MHWHTWRNRPFRIRHRPQQLGDEFNLKEFMDEFLEAGMIPMSLTRWEMTGYDDEIRKLW
jgi:uncharacterized protein (DUF885 family)